MKMISVSSGQASACAGSSKVIDVRDRQFVQMELDAAFHAHKSLFRKAFWINKGISADACELKIHQLLMAQTVGLLIPRTLISNKPKEIRAFIESTGNISTSH